MRDRDRTPPQRDRVIVDREFARRDTRRRAAAVGFLTQKAATGVARFRVVSQPHVSDGLITPIDRDPVIVKREGAPARTTAGTAAVFAEIPNADHLQPATVIHPFRNAVTQRVPVAGVHQFMGVVNRQINIGRNVASADQNPQLRRRGAAPKKGLGKLKSDVIFRGADDLPTAFVVVPKAPDIIAATVLWQYVIKGRAKA